MEEPEESGAYYKKLFERPFGNSQVNLAVNFAILYFLLRWNAEDWGIPGLLPGNTQHLLSIVALTGVAAAFGQFHRHMGSTPVTHSDYRRFRQALKGYVQVYSFTEKKKVTKRIPPWVTIPLALVGLAIGSHAMFQVIVAPWVGATYPPDAISIYDVFLTFIIPVPTFGMARVLASAFYPQETESEAGWKEWGSESEGGQGP